MKDFVEMDFETWRETYKPINNDLNKDAPFDGTLFDIVGAEFDFLKTADEECVWMYGVGSDGGNYIWSGWGFVNRIGFFITEEPCPDSEEIEVKVI